jgi:hypothetical protein
LLTSAYAGLAATLLVLGLAAGLLRRGRSRAGPVLAAAAVALPAGVAYGIAVTRVVSVGEIAPLPAGIAQVPLWAGSASLASLAGWSPGIDTFLHSMGPAVGWTSLLLAAVAPLVVRRERLWVALLVTAAVALGLALGPRIGPLFRRDLVWSWTPWSLLDPSLLGGFRFPCRLMLLTSFGLAAVGALAADRLARTWPRLAWVLFPAAGVDLFVIERVVQRTGVVPMEVPSAYAGLPAAGAVLDLLPTSLRDDADLELFLRSLTLGYQVRHGHPLVQPWGSEGQGVISGYTGSPGLLLDQAFDSWFFADICPTGQPDPAAGRACAVRPWLAGLGVGAVVLRPLLWRPEERTRVLDRMEQGFGVPVADSVDAGEWVLVFEVGDPPADRAAAVEAWARWSGA